MANEKPTSQVGGLGGELSKWLGYLKPVDKGLDRTKAAVEAAKTDLAKLRAGTGAAIDIKKVAQKGLEEDLGELGIIDKKDQAPYITEFEAAWGAATMDKRMEAKDESAQLAAIDAFINNTAHLTKISELIQKAEPRSKLQAMLATWGITQEIATGLLGEKSFLLGMIFPRAKKAADGTDAATGAPVAPAVGPDGKPIDGAAAAKPAESKEKPTGRKVGFFGDSITASLMSLKGKDARSIDGTQAKVFGKKSRQTDDLLTEVKNRKSDIQELTDVVILTGSNDVAGTNAKVLTDKIIAVYKEIKTINPKIRVHGVTLPPGKGNSEWNSNFAAIEATRVAVNAELRKLGSPTVDGMIDLAAKEKEGGLADNNDSQQLAEHLRTDPVHPDPKALMDAYRRALGDSSTTPASAPTSAPAVAAASARPTAAPRAAAPAAPAAAPPPPAEDPAPMPASLPQVPKLNLNPPTFGQGLGYQATTPAVPLPK